MTMRRDQDWTLGTAPTQQESSLLLDTDFSGVHPENDEQNPTLECMLFWVAVYRIMDRCLFGGNLPNCMITLERMGCALGYFRPSSFKNRNGETTHQIAMNPAYFESLGDLEAFQTFAHEMCHLWREVFGPRNRNGCTGTRGYHCRHWGGKMIEIGLMPSHTGKPGGCQTGYQMADYVIEGSKFDMLARELLASGRYVEWRDAASQYVAAQPPEDVPDLEGMLLLPQGGAPAAPQKPKRRGPTRAKFVCPSCELKAYAKPGARLRCGDCGLRMPRDFGGAV